MDFFKFYQKSLIEAQIEIRKAQEDMKLEMKRMKGWKDTKSQIVKDILEHIDGGLTVKEIASAMRVNTSDIARVLAYMRTTRQLAYDKKSRKYKLC